MTKHKLEAIQTADGKRFIHCYTCETDFTGKAGMNDLIGHLAKDAVGQIEKEKTVSAAEEAELRGWATPEPIPEPEPQETVPEINLHVVDEPEQKCSPLETLFTMYKGRDQDTFGVAFDELSLTVLNRARTTQDRKTKAGKEYTTKVDVLIAEDSAGRKIEVRLYGDDMNKQTAVGDILHFNNGWYKVMKGTPIVTKGSDLSPDNPRVEKVGQWL